MRSLITSIIVLLISGTAFANTTEKKYGFKDYVKKAEQIQLADDPQWKALLYYMNNWFSDKESVIDDPNFFLSDHGKTEADLELKATLYSYFYTKENSEGKKYQCIFPARYKFLKDKLGIRSADLKEEPCPELQKWLKITRSKKVYLSFSSFYAGNPGSLFGHTFLRFKTEKSAESSNANTDLLDLGVNFAATMHIDHPLTTVPYGLFGGFKGHFSLGAYFIKVQEYNNAEQRDLWEYELNYTQKQIDMMILSIAEVGRYSMDYFYFDDNCALIMLGVLDVGNPEYRFAENFNFWVIPGDTVRSVHKTNGAVKNIAFRPSTYRKYVHKYKQLGANENKVVKRLLDYKGKELAKEELLKVLKDLDERSQASVLETFVDYIDYDEKLAASNKLTDWKGVRHTLLLARSKLKSGSSFSNLEAPEDEMPHKAHGPTRIGFSFVSGEEDTRGLNLNWRPALHDPVSSSLGYSDSLAIDLLNVDLAVKNEFDDKEGRDKIKLYLNSVKYIDVFNLGLMSPLDRSTAWRLRISSFKNLESDDYSHQLNYGYGFGDEDGNKERLFYLFGAEAGRGEDLGDNEFKNYIAPWVNIGKVFNPNFGGKILLEVEFAWRLFADGNNGFYTRTNLEYAYMVKDAHELRAGFTHAQERDEIKLSYYNYF